MSKAERVDLIPTEERKDGYTVTFKNNGNSAAFTWDRTMRQWNMTKCERPKDKSVQSPWTIRDGKLIMENT